MVDVSNKQNSVVIKVTGSNGNTNITATADTAQYWSKQSRLSAENSKESAQESKHYAELANSYIEGFENVVSMGIADIEDARVDAVDNINTTKTSAINSITTTKNSAISDIDTTAKSYDTLTHRQITNCITKIPQRIRYTFENGTFTLLKGSVMIFPQGTANLSSTYPVGSEYRTPSLKVVDTQFADNKFFVWAEIQKDIVLNKAGDVTGTNNFFFVDSDNATIAWYGVPTTYSGGTVPTSGQCWYDTTNNIINTTSNSFATYINNNFSLPICDFAREAGAITSINQVFNGFGYIGNTIFADKGIKVLIPNGRNEDGTLKNVEITTNSVLSDTRNINSSTFKLVLNSVSFSNWQTANYDFERNYCTNANGENIGRTIVGTCETDTNGKIIKFEPYQAFRAVDYNDYRTEIDTINASINTKVNKSGDIMTGDLTINKPTNSWPTIAFQSKGTMGETSDTVQYGARLISRDTRNQYFATYEHAIAEDGRARAYMIARSTNDGGTTYSSHRLEIACFPNGTGGIFIDSKFLKAFVTATYVNGTSWYRVWSDGWIEQGGFIKTTVGANKVETLTFLKAFTRTGYTAVISDYAYSTNDTTTGTSGDVKVWGVTGFTTTGMSIITTASASRSASWYVCGY